MLDHRRAAVLVAEPERELEAATRLGRIGFDTVAGYLAGGMQPLDDAPQLIERIERITAQALTEQLASDEPPVLIDVRSEREWRERHVEQAVHIPLSRLVGCLDTLPLQYSETHPSAVVGCGGGAPCRLDQVSKRASGLVTV